MIYLQFINLLTNFAPRKGYLTLYRESLTSDSEPRSSVLTNLPTLKDIIKDVLICLKGFQIFIVSDNFVLADKGVDAAFHLTLLIRIKVNLRKL